MAKRFSTLDTTRIIFEHPTVLFTLIQRMDEEGIRFIREHELVREVAQYTRNRDTTERQRLELALTTDNLFNAGLAVDIDKIDGERRLVLQESLVGLLRACNASLYQELTDARLRSRLVALWDVRVRLGASSFNHSDPDFTELLDDLFEQLSHLVGLLRQNIIRMQQISADLAKLSGDASRAPDAFMAFRQDLLTRIAHLYERHIKPTLSFLNPDLVLAEGENLFTTLRRVQNLLERNIRQREADQVFRTSLSINAMYKPIQLVAWEVDNFLRKTRTGMLQYNAMEHHYQRLVERYQDTQTQDLRKTRLSGQAFARENDFVIGLKQRSQPKRYAFGDTSSYYRMLFSEIELRLSDIRRQNEAPNLMEVAALSTPARTDIERIRKLYAWIDSLELRPTQDLVRELHGRLQGFIEGYDFPDLLAAMSRLGHRAPDGMRIATMNRFRTLSSEEGQTFVYRRRRLEMSNEHD
ncbi:MAG: hypothetical protein WED00_16450 [Aquisalimonadaceae bacterium]